MVKLLLPIPWSHSTRWRWVVDFTSQLLKGLECEFKSQLPIEKESGWAPEQLWYFGEEKNVLLFLGPGGCTDQSLGSSSFQTTNWTSFFKVTSVTWTAFYIMQLSLWRWDISCSTSAADCWALLSEHCLIQNRSSQWIIWLPVCITIKVLALFAVSCTKAVVLALFAVSCTKRGSGVETTVEGG